MYRIPLTKGKFAVVDEEDYFALIGKRWTCSPKGYAIHTVYIEKIDRRSVSKVFSMHRIITACPEDKEVDHINGNKLDNRRSNLRVCTASENAKNRLKQKSKASSVYKGVHWRETHNKWQARIHHEGVSRDLGRYALEDDAATAYNMAALRYYKGFASLNLIPHKRSA